MGSSLWGSKFVQAVIGFAFGITLGLIVLVIGIGFAYADQRAHGTHEIEVKAGHIRGE